MRIRTPRTSTDALSLCTSHSLSNCSTLASGSTNHWITSHSRIPNQAKSVHLLRIPQESLPRPPSPSSHYVSWARGNEKVRGHTPSPISARIKGLIASTLRPAWKLRRANGLRATESSGRRRRAVRSELEARRACIWVWRFRIFNDDTSKDRGAGGMRSSSARYGGGKFEETDGTV